ncbi:hypothetical protein WR25_26693 isoform B [Diploscapter pachys]|nr:hypothetical protein WR25_26693 isoform B [Diploscapter pachys]
MQRGAHSRMDLRHFPICLVDIASSFVSNPNSPLSTLTHRPVGIELMMVDDHVTLTSGRVNLDTDGPATWQGNGHTIVYSPYKYELIGPEKLWDDKKVHLFFAANWHCSIYLAIGYVILINVLQKFMENRKPYSMRKILFLWNAFLAVFSMIGTWRCGIEFVHMMTTRPFVNSLCHSVDPHGPAALWSCLFALSKIAEFGDTFFLILRKRPVIFLHWYHHAVVLILTWHSAVELTAAGRYFILMNYFVHSIMYTYYMITSVGYRLPKIVSM